MPPPLHLPVHMFDKRADSVYNGFQYDAFWMGAKLPKAMSSWEDDLDFADNGPKKDYQFWRCRDDADRDCRARLMALENIYKRIKLAQMLRVDNLSAKSAYNAMALRTWRTAPIGKK